MATKAELKAARELLDLDVREVSLVDRPANMREFLVVKRLEDPMGIYESDYASGGSPDPSQVSPTLVVQKADESQTTDGGDPVDVETITKAVEGETVDMTKGRHAYEVAALKSGKSEEAEEILTKRQEAELAKSEELAKAKADADKVGDKPGDKKPAFPGAKPFGKKTETTKAADAAPAPAADETVDDSQMVVVKRDGSIHVNGEVVHKGQTVSKLRTAAISAAVTALAKQFGELSDEDLAKALEGISKQMPKDPGFPTMSRPTSTKGGTELNPIPPTGMSHTLTKSVDADGNEINPIVAAVQEALAPITKRLEEIEKTRTPSQSTEPEGGTEKKEVKKGFWNGVL